MVSASYGDIDIVNALINRGIDVNAKTKNGWTALMLATKEKNNKVVDLLKKAGAVDLSKQAVLNYDLFCSIIKNNSDSISKLLRKGASVNLKQVGGIFTPLMLAEVLDHQKIITLLKMHAAQEIPLSSLDKTEINFALFIAADVGTAKYVRLLRAKGADGKKKVFHNTSAIERAYIRGYGEIVEILNNNNLVTGIRERRMRRNRIWVRSKILSWFRKMDNVRSWREVFCRSQ